MVGWGIDRAVRRAVARRGRRISRDAQKRAGRKSLFALDRSALADVRRWPHPRKSLATGLVAPWPRGRWRVGLRRAQLERAWRTARAPRKRERGKSHLEANFGVGRAQGKIAIETELLSVVVLPRTRPIT